MRQQLLSEGAKELSYEIREIVKKAEQIKNLGKEICWENIGDPIQKNHLLPEWIKQIIAELALQNETYSYCPSKGILDTRKFLAAQNNLRKGAQITPEDICFFNGLGDAIAKVYQYITPTSRIIGPSPAYSTHSSAEAAHASHEPLTYRLDPNNKWYPDLDDLYNKVKYNPNDLNKLAPMVMRFATKRGYLLKQGSVNKYSLKWRYFALLGNMSASNRRYLSNFNSFS